MTSVKWLNIHRGLILSLELYAMKDLRSVKFNGETNMLVFNKGLHFQVLK